MRTIPEAVSMAVPAKKGEKINNADFQSSNEVLGKTA